MLSLLPSDHPLRQVYLKLRGLHEAMDELTADVDGACLKLGFEPPQLSELGDTDA